MGKVEVSLSNMTWSVGVAEHGGSQGVVRTYTVAAVFFREIAFAVLQSAPDSTADGEALAAHSVNICIHFYRSLCFGISTCTSSLSC